MIILANILLMITLKDADSAPIDLRKLHCIRQEIQNEQKFVSEIHFKNQERLSLYEGELLNYIVKGSNKRYISGFNLFNIIYEPGVISGLSGDATRADGSFTLTRMTSKTSGKWFFIYSGKTRTKIDAEFKCAYYSVGNAKKSDDTIQRY